MFLLQTMSIIIGFLIALLLIVDKTREKFLQLKYTVRLLKETNGKLQRDVEDIFGIYEGIKTATMTLNLEEILQGMNYMMHKFFDFSQANLYLFEDSAVSDVSSKPKINFQYDFINKISNKNITEVMDEEIKKVIVSKKEILFPYDKRLHSFDEDEKYQKIYMIIPMIIENKVIGVIRMEREGEPFLPFSEDDINKLSILCAQTAVILRRAHLYQEVEKLAIVDGLTGLYVHRYFQENIVQEIKRAQIFNEKLPLLMIDIDYFKKYNDEYGHLAGDEILRQISRVMKSTVRDTDFAARYGGEEFAIMLLHQDREQAIKVAEEIRSNIENMKFVINEKNTKVTVSIGVAMFPEDAGLPEELIDKADKSLYEAKKKGRNCVVISKQDVK